MDTVKTINDIKNLYKRLKADRKVLNWGEFADVAKYDRTYISRVLNGDMYSLMRQLRHSELNTTQIYLKSLGLVDNAAIRSAVW